MKRFLEFIEAAREGGVGYMTKGDRRQARHPLGDEDWANIEKCQPFVFMPTEPMDVGVKPTDDENFYNRTDKLPDAPFPVFSIEVLGPGPVGSLNRLNEVLRNPEDIFQSGMIHIFCIVVVEVRPTEFIYFISCHTALSKLSVVMAAPFIIRPIVDEYLKRLSVEKLGLESTRTSVKLGTGKSKRLHRIRRIINVAPKKAIAKYPETFRHVDWTHRFEVRGHWRQLESMNKLGKDREGNYTVTGHTWVSHHVRGPENLPLVKKTRVVGEENADPVQKD